MYDEQGEKTWDCTLDVYGKVATFEGSSLKECPFRYQGQYEDEETGLYYNRFRYYEPELGSYVSQDPIGLAGNNPTLYGYVYDTNAWIDLFALKIVPTITKGSNGEILTGTATVTKSDLGTGSPTNASSRAHARNLGNASDDAGHIIGNQLGGSGGKKNVFPQDFHVNRGEFAQFESRVSKFVDKHGSANITVKFEYGNGGTRPTKIHYEAEAPNGKKISKSFNNHH